MEQYTKICETCKKRVRIENFVAHSDRCAKAHQEELLETIQQEILNTYRYVPDGVQCRGKYVALNAEGKIINEDGHDESFEEITHSDIPSPEKTSEFFIVNGKGMMVNSVLMPVGDGATSEPVESIEVIPKPSKSLKEDDEDLDDFEVVEK